MHTESVSIQPNSSSQVLTFIYRHFGKIISFFLPVFTYLYLSMQQAIIPYGNYSIYTTKDTSDMLTNFHSIYSMIHSGSFSLMYKTGTSMDFGSTIPLIGLKPLLIPLLFMSEEHAISFLPVINAILIGISGLSMYLYLKNTKLSSIKYGVLWSILFSLAYSLSSCMTVQTVQFYYNDIAALFPLLFMYYETMMQSGRKKPFSLLLFYMLLCQFQLSIAIMIILFFHILICSDSKIKDALHKALSFLVTCLQVLAAAAFWIFPGLITIIRMYKATASFKLPILLDSPFGYISRFFFGSDASYFYTSEYGINIYCGSFTMILAFTYLVFSPDKRLKIKRIGFACLLSVICLLRPVLSAFFLFHVEKSFFNPLSFLIVFFIIRAANNCLSDIEVLTLRSIILILVGIIILYALCIRFSSHITGTVNMIFGFSTLVSIAIILTEYKRQSISHKTFAFLISIAFIFDISYTAYNTIVLSIVDNYTINDQITNMHKAEEKALRSYLFSSASSTENMQDDPLTSFFTDDYYLIPGNTEYIHEDAPNPDVISRVNAIAKENGCEKDLLKEIRISPELNSAEESSIKSFENGQIELSFPTDKESSKHYFTLSVKDHPVGEIYLIFDNRLYYKGQVEKNKSIKQFLNVPESALTDHCYKTSFSIAQLDTDALNSLSEQLSTLHDTRHTYKPFSVMFSCSASQNGTLVFPYMFSEHNHIYLDGKKITPYCGPSKRSAITLTPGNHTIQIKKNCIAFLLGFIISFLFLTLYFVCSFQLMKPVTKRTQNRTK